MNTIWCIVVFVTTRGIAMKMLQRMLPLGEGKRTAIKLDSATWQAVDWLADEKGQKWQEWCLTVVHAAEEDENLTAAIRAAAMDGILMATILSSRATLNSVADEHPLLRYSAMMNDEELAENLRSSHIAGVEEMGGFTLHAGEDEAGQPCLWIENQLKGWPNLVISVPKRNSDNND